VTIAISPGMMKCREMEITSSNLTAEFFRRDLRNLSFAEMN